MECTRITENLVWANDKCGPHLWSILHTHSCFFLSKIKNGSLFCLGELTEDAIPESRVEVGESMPSVKNLLTRFKGMQSPEPETGGVKRVRKLGGFK